MTSPDLGARLSRPVIAIVAAIAFGTVLGACGNNGLSLAKQACTHVDRSILLLQQAARQTDPSRAAQLDHQAYAELLDALPISAQAAYRDAQWQALMTTLSESNSVPEPTLVPALVANCRLADNSVFGQPSPPSSIPPPSSP